MNNQSCVPRCFANIDGKLKPGRLGLFSSACRDCSYYTTKGDNMLKCKCYAGRDQDNLIESTVNLGERRWVLLAGKELGLWG